MAYRQGGMQNLCTKCSQVITNPVCERCHTSELKQWLRDLNIGAIPRKLVLDKVAKEMTPETFNDDMCIVCGEETLSTCSYCFFLTVARVLKEMNFPDRVVARFLEVFNYRHGHEDYEL
jgi:hypothetical protein